MTLIMYAAPPHINLITLGLPVIDAAGTRVTVTMNADGAMAAFGEFSAEHALPDFFKTSPRFTCTPFWPTPGSPNAPFATRRERAPARRPYMWTAGR